MKVLIINQNEIYRLLPMEECIDLMASTLAALARGEALNPLRNTMWLPERTGVLATMPAHLGPQNALGLKVITVFPRNHGTEFDSHQGAVMLFDGENGRLLAIVDASAITELRTAAVSGVATRLLAKEEAGDLAILGSGVQARSHLQAMLAVRSLKRVRVWSRTAGHAIIFAEMESKRHGVEIEPLKTAREAVMGADIVCTTTSANEPVLFGDWLSPGVHINAVGSSVPFARELDTAALVKALLFVDKRESTINEAGDFLIPKQEGAVSDDHILGEIGEILLGRVSGRLSAGEITLFKSLGLAVEDVASAHAIYQKAVELGVGTAVEVGGSRQFGF